MPNVTALMPEGRQRYYNNDGSPAAGAKLYTYAAGTSALKPTYADADGTTPNPNPIPLDAKGEAVIYWNGAYKVDLKQANGQQVTGYPVDNLKTDPAGIWGALAALAAAGGAALLGYLHSPGVAPTTLQAALRAELANVNLHFVAGETDHTGMFTRAAAAGRRVYVPAGSYNVNAVKWPANTEFFGDGDASVINMPKAAAYAFTCDSNSPDPANNISNLRMSNLQLRATCDADGFSEFKHLVALNGVSNVVFQHVLFKGFRGDGLYIGSSNTAGQERHNQNVSVKRCRFDGINRENRNGISFIDIDGGLVDGCTFTNCSRPDQPGPIDLEPDAFAFPIIKNVTIRRNRFIANGGGVGEVCVYVPAAVTAPPSNITVENNSSAGYVGTGQFFFFSDNRAPTATSPENDIKVLYNNVKNGCIPFGIFTGKRVLLQGNLFSDMTKDAKIGYVDAISKPRDVSLMDNRLVRCGSVAGNALSIFSVDYLSIVRNRFIDCGTGAPGASNCLDFNIGTSSYVVIEENEWSAPTGKTQAAIALEAAHTLTPATNRYMRNTVAAGLQMGFQAEESDMLEQPFWPVITGSGGDGAGVYPEQYGRYRRIGKTVYFRIKLTANAGHSGVAMIQVGLPTRVADTPNNEESPVALAVDGAATVGGQIGLVNPALIVAGKGAIRCFHTATGVLAQTLIPAGAFTITASGSYQMP